MTYIGFTVHAGCSKKKLPGLHAYPLFQSIWWLHED